MERGILQARAARTPGVRRMTQRHIDADGNRWPAGTEFRPLRGGFASGGRYVEVTIDARAVRFFEGAAPEPGE